MAGVRQHIIPQFLLKGFASRVKGNQIYTWFYRKEGNFSETNITNIGVCRYFYGKQGEISVDNEITILEGEYAPILESLRRMPHKTEVFDSKVPEIITHICTRTKYIRDSFVTASDFLLSRISNFLSEDNTVKNLVLKHLDSNPENLKYQLDRRLKYFPATEDDKEKILQILPVLLPQELERIKKQLKFSMQDLVKELQESLPSTVKEAHINTLSQSLIPEVRVEAYRELRWFIYKTDSSLILGDTGCLFETLGTNKFKSIDDKNDKVKNIYLPISNDTILIGTSLPTLPQVESRVINEAIAKCSREFFICSEYSPEILELIPMLQKESEIISRNELENIFRKNTIINSIKSENTTEETNNPYYNSDYNNSLLFKEYLETYNNAFKMNFDKETFYHLFMNGQIIDGRHGGLLIGKNLEDGGIDMIMEIQPDIFQKVGKIEGGQYIISQAAYLKNKERIDEINNSTNKEYNKLEEIKITTRTRILNTYDSIKDKFVFVESEQFIVNKVSTTKYLNELENLNHL